MKRLMLAALAAVFSAGCVAPNGAKRPTSTAAASQSKQPAYLPLPKAVGANKNQCFAGELKGYEGILVYGGANNQGQFYSCAPGATLQIPAADPYFVSSLVPYLCDATRPVTQTPVWEGTLLRVTCVYRDSGIPQSVQGERLQVVR